MCGHFSLPLPVYIFSCSATFGPQEADLCVCVTWAPLLPGWHPGGVRRQENNAIDFPACTAASALSTLSQCAHSSLLQSQGRDGFIWYPHSPPVPFTLPISLYVDWPLKSGSPKSSTVRKCPTGIGKVGTFCLLGIVWNILIHLVTYTPSLPLIFHHCVLWLLGHKQRDVS